MNYIDVGTAKIAYRIFGSGPIKLVIEGALNSCNAEWWNFTQALGDIPTLVYDRAGYGESTKSSLNRTPINIVIELEKLLKKVDISDQIVLLGHSQGGLYSTLFALRNKKLVKALILLDPLSVIDNNFKNSLSDKEFYSSGIDKTSSLRIGKLITGLHLGFLFKGLLKKAPPFYYSKFDKDSENYILKALLKRKQYETALLEYEYSHIENELKQIEGELNSPIFLIRHNSEKMIEEIMYFGNCNRELAEKIENTWIDIMREMKKFSKINMELVANNSSHYIHLTDQQLVIDKIREII